MFNTATLFDTNFEWQILPTKTEASTVLVACQKKKEFKHLWKYIGDSVALCAERCTYLTDRAALIIVKKENVGMIKDILNPISEDVVPLLHKVEELSDDCPKRSFSLPIPKAMPVEENEDGNGDGLLLQRERSHSCSETI